MQVILLQAVHNLGKLGDVVDVKPGHARNYLVPQHIALFATEDNKKVFQQRKADLIRQSEDKLAKCQMIAELAPKTVLMKPKATPTGKLFGSVGAVELVDKLNAELPEGVPAFHKSQPRFGRGAVKTNGHYTIEMVLHPEVRYDIELYVNCEPQPEPEPDATLEEADAADVAADDESTRSANESMEESTEESTAAPSEASAEQAETDADPLHQPHSASSAEPKA